MTLNLINANTSEFMTDSDLKWQTHYTHTDLIYSKLIKFTGILLLARYVRNVYSEEEYMRLMYILRTDLALGTLKMRERKMQDWKMRDQEFRK